MATQGEKRKPQELWQLYLKYKELDSKFYTWLHCTEKWEEISYSLTITGLSSLLNDRLDNVDQPPSAVVEALAEGIRTREIVDRCFYRDFVSDSESQKAREHHLYYLDTLKGWLGRMRSQVSGKGPKPHPPHPIAEVVMTADTSHEIVIDKKGLARARRLANMAATLCRDVVIGKLDEANGICDSFQCGDINIIELAGCLDGIYMVVAATILEFNICNEGQTAQELLAKTFDSLDDTWSVFKQRTTLDSKILLSSDEVLALRRKSKKKGHQYRLILTPSVPQARVTNTEYPHTSSLIYSVGRWLVSRSMNSLESTGRPAIGKMRMNAMWHAYHLSWIQYKELGEMALALLRLDHLTIPTLHGKRPTKSNKKPAPDVSLDALGKINDHLVTAGSAALSPWLAGRLIARHHTASRAYFRLTEGNSASKGVLSSLVRAGDVSSRFPGLRRWWEGAGSGSKLQEAYEVPGNPKSTRDLEGQLRDYDTDAATFGWWSEMVVVTAMTGPKNTEDRSLSDMMDTLQSLYAEMRRAFMLRALRFHDNQDGSGAPIVRKHGIRHRCPSMADALWSHGLQINGNIQEIVVKWEGKRTAQDGARLQGDKSTKSTIYRSLYRIVDGAEELRYSLGGDFSIALEDKTLAYLWPWREASTTQGSFSSRRTMLAETELWMGYQPGAKPLNMEARLVPLEDQASLPFHTMVRIKPVAQFASGVLGYPWQALDMDFLFPNHCPIFKHSSLHSLSCQDHLWTDNAWSFDIDMAMVLRTFPRYRLRERDVRFLTHGTGPNQLTGLALPPEAGLLKLPAILKDHLTRGSRWYTVLGKDKPLELEIVRERKEIIIISTLSLAQLSRCMWYLGTLQTEELMEEAMSQLDSGTFADLEAGKVYFCMVGQACLLQAHFTDAEKYFRLAVQLQPEGEDAEDAEDAAGGFDIEEDVEKLHQFSLEMLEPGYLDVSAIQQEVMKGSARACTLVDILQEVCDATHW